jgi:hypothetical protein
MCLAFNQTSAFFCMAYWTQSLAIGRFVIAPVSIHVIIIPNTYVHSTNRTLKFLILQNEIPSLNTKRFSFLSSKDCNNHVNKPIRKRNNKKIAASSRKLYSSVPSINSTIELWPFALLEGNKNMKLDAISATMADGLRNF